MAKLFNLARMTTATTGTGTLTLGVAAPGYLSFVNAGIQTGDIASYVIVEGVNRESGRGTFTSPDQFARTTVLNSTAGGTTKINLSGAAEVMITALKEDIANLNETNIFTATQGITSPDTGAAVDLSLDLFRDSASPAAEDILFPINFYGRSSTGAKRLYANIEGRIDTTTNGSETGRLHLRSRVAGTEDTRWIVKNGFYGQNTTGGDKGADTINAVNYYKEGYLTKPIVQEVNTQTGAVATGTTTIPNDDTIPQNTEGTQFMTMAITPKASANLLKIDVVFCAAYTTTASNRLIVALFQDTTANALAAASMRNSANNSMVTVSFRHYMTAGTTSSTTFKIRAGTSAADTVTFNGEAGARLFGGVIASSITITEIAA